MDRKADANETPDLVFTWAWLIFARSYSMGSSTVTIFTSGRSNLFRVE